MLKTKQPSQLFSKFGVKVFDDFGIQYNKHYWGYLTSFYHYGSISVPFLTLYEYHLLFFKTSINLTISTTICFLTLNSRFESLTKK